MAFFLPAPSMMVVFSFSTRTFLALPSISSVTFSSLMPRSSLMSWPPVRMAMSSSIALRRSPKPGALTAATLRPPRLHHRLEHRQHRLEARELLLMQQDERVLQLAHHLLGIGDEVGREIAPVELHALDDVELGLEALRLLDRDHALVADLLHRLGDHFADLALAIAGDGADL